MNDVGINLSIIIMKQDIENIINLVKEDRKNWYSGDGNKPIRDAIDSINSTLIAGEVLKVVVEKIKEEIKNNVAYGNFGFSRMDFKHEGQIAINMNDILQLLSNLSPNKENENNA